jgi:GT2 family glycosyltransferase
MPKSSTARAIIMGTVIMGTVPSPEGAAAIPWSPLVSVIIPTHLADPPFLREALASVIDQEWAQWEAIVVDDGSSGLPGTLENLAAVDPRVSLVRSPKSGASRARNFGLARARGELVAFLDSDDYWYPKHLSCAVGALARHEEAVATYSSMDVVRGADKELLEVSRRSGPTNRYTALSEGNRPLINSLVARRRAVEAVGGFDPEFGGAEDKDMIYKLLEQGPCLYLDEVTAAYRVHEGNSSADNIRVSIATTRVLAAHRRRAQAAGNTEAVAAITLGRRRMRRYDAGVAVSNALAAAKSGNIKKAAVQVAWAVWCSPPEAARTARKRAWHKLRSLLGPAKTGPGRAGTNS